MSVAQDEWAESAHEIDVAVVVNVPDERPLTARDDRWIAADRPIRPDRAVYAARKKLCGPFTPCRAYAGLDHVAPRRAVISAMGR